MKRFTVSTHANRGACALDSVPFDTLAEAIFWARAYVSADYQKHNPDARGVCFTQVIERNPALPSPVVVGEFTKGTL